MKENCLYGMWKNRLPFHTMPWVPDTTESRQKSSEQVGFKIIMRQRFAFD